MSDTNTEKKQGFFKGISGWLSSFDKTVHETPVKRVEDLFAIIGISTAVNRSFSFIGVFATILSIMLDRGVALWGWITENWDQVQTGLKDWAPFQHAQNEPFVVMAARRLRDYHHLYRSLIILCMAGVLISLSTWLVAIAGLPGFTLLLVALMIIFVWSISTNLAHVVIGPLVGALVIGVLALVPYYLGWHFWMMAFCIFTIFVSISMLAALLWPIYVIARYFSTQAKPVGEPSKWVTETRWLSIKNYVLSYVKALFWPVSLMVYAIMFTAWEIPVHYLSIIFIIVALACAAIKTLWIRTVLNSLTVGNEFAFIGLMAYLMFFPVDMRASIEYQAEDYGYDAIGICSFRTDAGYYWDVNNNSRPDSIDMKYLKDALADSTLFPQADRRFADINGDNESNGADTVYFRRFMDKTGPNPVKATWLGTPKPSAPALAQSDSAGGGQVAEAISSTLEVDNFSKKFDPPIVFQNSTQWFDINLLEVEVNQSHTKLVLSWSNPRTNEERVSIGQGTKIVDESGNSYQLHNSFPVKVGDWLRFYPGQTKSIELYFEPVKKSGSQRFQVILPDIWNHTFTSSFNS